MRKQPDNIAQADHLGLDHRENPARRLLGVQKKQKGTFYQKKNQIALRNDMDENYNYVYVSHFQNYAYEDQRTEFHDESLAKAGFLLLHTDEKNIVYKHYKGNIYWGIAGSDRMSDYLTGASLYVTETPKGNYEQYSNQITDIYENIRKMYPVGRLYISGHSPGGAMAKELLRKYPHDRNLRVDGFNSAPARITRVDDRYYSFRSSHDPVSIFDDADSIERNIFSSGTHSMSSARVGTRCQLYLHIFESL